MSAPPDSIAPLAGSAARASFAWALGALFFFYAFVQRVAPSVMVAEFMRDFAVGGAVVGNMAAFYLYAYAGLQIPLGLMFDRLGARRLMAGAALICALGGWLFAGAGALWEAYLGRMLVGVGAAASWVGVLTVTAQWFPPARFALFGGLAQMMGMAGAVFGQAPLAEAVRQFGWRPTLTAIALAAVALAIGLYVAVRDRPLAAVRRHSIGADLAAVTRNPQTWFAAAYGLAMTGPMLAFGGLWAVPFLGQAYGLDRAAAAAATSLLFIGWGIGAPFMGWLSDRIGLRRPPMIGGAACAAATLAAIIYIPALPMAVLGALMLVHGIAASSMIVLFAAVREHNRPAASGMAMGFANTAVVGSGAVFQPLIGALLDLGWDGTLVEGARIYASGGYRAAFAVLLVATTLGIAAACAQRETHCRPVVRADDQKR